MRSDHCLMAITGVHSLGGGIAAANRLALSALLEADYQVDVIALNESPDTVPDTETKSSYQGMQNNKIAFAKAVWQSVLQKRYTIVFCDHVNLALVLAPLAKLGICRYIVRLNGVEVFPEDLNWEGKVGLKAAHQRLAISDHTRQQVLHQYPRMDIQVCGLSLDPERSQLVASSPSVTLSEITLTCVAGTEKTLGQRVILHVGRMSAAEQYKGQDVLIEAMPAILAASPDAQLVLVGKGDDVERLWMLAKSQSEVVQQAVFMTGFVSDEQLEQLYRSCYVFAMPSRGEGFGLVYLEAMAYGKPCIGSRIDSARCIIRHDETGLLVDHPTHSREVAEHLMTILRQPELARSMGTAGYKLLNEYYLFPHFQERFIRMLRQR